jgi:hypothetical protein
MIADPRSHVSIFALTDKPESASIVSEWADVPTASNILFSSTWRADFLGGSTAKTLQGRMTLARKGEL